MSDTSNDPLPRRLRRHPPPELGITTGDLIRRRKLWPIPEAAELLGVTRSTLYRWERLGLINFVRVEHRTLVSDSELDRFVARPEVASTRPKDQPA